MSKLNKTVTEGRQGYLVGVDGGGSGTRVALARMPAYPESEAIVELARAEAGPSGLALGIDAAWRAVREAIEQAFARAALPLDWSACKIACGIAGANHAPWREAFIAAAPAVAGLRVEEDAYTTLWGAHGGRAGVVVALGTGSVGIVLDERGDVVTVGGFGFPSGDEASGAWLGLRAIAHAQKAVDHRGPRDALAWALLVATGVVDGASIKEKTDDGMAADWRDAAGMRERLLAWLVTANQTAYASLAPTLARHADHYVVAALLKAAGEDVDAMVSSLDKAESLPLALCGSLAPLIRPFIARRHTARLIMPQGDAVNGALRLAASLPLPI